MSPGAGVLDHRVVDLLGRFGLPVVDRDRAQDHGANAAAHRRLGDVLRAPEVGRADCHLLGPLLDRRPAQESPARSCEIFA
jgi:hypothetical protein